MHKQSTGNNKMIMKLKTKQKLMFEVNDILFFNFDDLTVSIQWTVLLFIDFHFNPQISLLYILSVLATVAMASLLVRQ